MSNPTGTNTFVQKEVDDNTISTTNFSDNRDRVKVIKEESWNIFVNSFLKLALLGCETLLKDSNIKDENRILIVSILFNLKHGLEVAIKYFMKAKSQEDNDIEQKHDLKKNFTKLKKSMPDRKLKADIQQLSIYITKYYDYDLVRKYIDASNYTIVDTENTFFRYPENGAKISVNYPDLLSKIGIADVENIRKDIIEILKIIDKIKSII